MFGPCPYMVKYGIYLRMYQQNTTDMTNNAIGRNTGHNENYECTKTYVCTADKQNNHSKTK
jgi:hypothetical protein